MQSSAAGNILSVNVGQPKPLTMGHRTVLSSIVKDPVEGRVAVRGVNLEGDGQADLRVHGGRHKAVYLYPSEHYSFWKEQLGLQDLPFGAFGENLTTSGLLEETVCIGDRFRFGTAVLQVSQPRMPCYKLGFRFQRSDMVKRFWESGRSGMYLCIVEEGELGAGDTITKVASGPHGVTVADVVRLYIGQDWSGELRQRALRAPLYGSWKEGIRLRLSEESYA